MNLTGIRQALAQQVQTGIARGFTVYPYDTGACFPPCIVIGEDDPYVTYHITSGDRCQIQVELMLEVRLTSADGASARIAMDDVLVPGNSNYASIIEAVERDKTLGGTVGDVWVSQASAPGYNMDGELIAILPIHIIANKS